MKSVLICLPSSIDYLLTNKSQWLLTVEVRQKFSKARCSAIAGTKSESPLPSPPKLNFWTTLCEISTSDKSSFSYLSPPPPTPPSHTYSFLADKGRGERGREKGEPKLAIFSFPPRGWEGGNYIIRMVGVRVGADQDKYRYIVYRGTGLLHVALMTLATAPSLSLLSPSSPGTSGMPRRDAPTPD